MAEDDLFAALSGSNARPRSRPELAISLVAHSVVVALLVLLPLFASDRPPEPSRDALRVFLSYDPPPPPPPPMMRGPGLAPRAVPQAAPTVTPVETPALVAPSTPTVSVEPEKAEPNRDPAGGDPAGSILGEPGGMPGGVPGGVIGGVPGGVVGGVIGGTGTGPVPVPVRFPDRPPRPLRMTKPQYPHEAFVKKLEGTVVLEILIDDQGHVAQARVLQSVPMLDQAALDAVQLWLFVPAMHAGRAVAALAQAPVTFRIY